jgi:hypothetical protein
MPECPNCGLSWEYCVVCGEPCSNNEESTPTLIHGEQDDNEGGVVCDNCRGNKDENEGDNDNDGGNPKEETSLPVRAA